MSHAKTAESIEMPSGIWTWVGPKKSCIRWGFESPKGKRHFGGMSLPIVKYRKYPPLAGVIR